jgi:hypothetical protein
LHLFPRSIGLWELGRGWGLSHHHHLPSKELLLSSSTSVGIQVPLLPAWEQGLKVEVGR